MRARSPIGTHSPFKRPRITFNYPLSPLKQQPSNNPTLSHPKTPSNQSSNLSNLICESTVQKYNPDRKHSQVKYEGKTGNDQQKGESKYKQNTRSPTRSNEIFKQQGNFKQPEGQMPHIQLEGLLNKSKMMKEELESLLQKLSNSELADQGIKKIYLQKKIALKKHYELIKATIKLSIQRDLQELQLREKKSLKCLDEVKSSLSAGIASMDSLKHRIQNIFNEISFSSDVSQLQKIVSQSKQSVSSASEQKTKASQIFGQLSCKQVSKQDNKWEGDSLELKETQNQLGMAKSELYDPLNYILLVAGRSHSDTLFSFHQKIR